MIASKKLLFPMAALFVFASCCIFFLKGLLAKWNLRYDIMLLANTLFFIISILAVVMQQKALHNSNPNVFIRSVMGGMMLKMAFCVAAVAVYVVGFPGSYSAGTIFICMFLYLLYLGVEVFTATKLNRQKNG